ncbi:MAG: hypothetical protein HZA19_02120 [Nitrospirae bacterium]|nr:hypothetical protein [Nitrospirota bacterium]
MIRRCLIGMIGTILLLSGSLTAEAAPIGVPAATTGEGKAAVGVEVNILADRDLTDGGGEMESTQVFATGKICLNNRLDLLFRLGFADYSADPPGRNIDTDIGPAFGVGFKTTWATFPQSRLKIGSVFQTTHTRAEDDSIKRGFNEYDAALGMSLDMNLLSMDSKQRASQLSLIPYGGFTWSGLDVNGNAWEDDSFGLFLGIQAKTRTPVSFGAEIRLVDQTAISLNLSVGL